MSKPKRLSREARRAWQLGIDTFAADGGYVDVVRESHLTRFVDAIDTARRLEKKLLKTKTANDARLVERGIAYQRSVIASEAWWIGMEWPPSSNDPCRKARRCQDANLNCGMPTRRRPGVKRTSPKRPATDATERSAEGAR